MSETQIILIVAALAVIAFFFWRSLREERRLRASRKTPLKRESFIRKDVLEEEPEPELALRQEPQLATEENASQEAPQQEPTVEINPEEQPSDVPPIYEQMGKKKMTELKGALDESGFLGRRTTGMKEPPVDRGIQWILDITPYEGKCFPYGAIDSLVRQVSELSLPLPVSLWAKAKDDGLYYQVYPENALVGDAVHLIATLVIANRASVLHEVMASSFLQVLEQAAAQDDVDVRMSTDMPQVIATATQISRFVAYYDKMLELKIIPSPDKTLTYDELVKLGEAAGFKSASARLEYRMDPKSSEPVMTLEMGPDGMASLRLVFDVPMASLSRGDLKRFFQLANHFANHLGGVWVDCAGNRIEASGAMMLQDEIEARALQMTTSGVRPGSERAHLLFSRSACQAVPA